MQGPPGAPAVLLLHGWMATAALNWYGSLDFLGHSFHAVAPDLRGHGREGCGAPRFTVEGCADDLAALIDELSLAPAIVVGYSMGGAIAQVLARRHRQVVRGLVLCATAASFARRLKLRPAARVSGRLGGMAARRWPGTAHRFLTWRIDRHDRKVERERQEGHGSGRDQSPQVLDAAGEGDQVAVRSPLEWALAERSMSDLAAFIEAGVALNVYDSSRWLPQLDVPSAVLITTRATLSWPPGARRPWLASFPTPAGTWWTVATTRWWRSQTPSCPSLRDACTDLWRPV